MPSMSTGGGRSPNETHQRIGAALREVPADRGVFGVGWFHLVEDSIIAAERSKRLSTWPTPPRVRVRSK
jgi:hypothetical protein